MKKRYIIIGILSIIIIFLFIFCNPMRNVARTILYIIRTSQPFFLSEKEKLAKDFYNAVYSAVNGYHLERVKKVLDRGADPDYCLGECGWVDSNPLNIVAESYYDTYYRRKYDETIPNPTPDVAVLNLLWKAGADINRRPYIWNRIYLIDNKFITEIYNDKSDDLELKKRQTKNVVEDANRLIEVFLKAGADPDKKGHPYPYSYEAMKAGINDKQANEYFAKGSRAINVAIEKGIAWESQVDLLLQYTKLDNESLKAAERSNDPDMIVKINKLWKKQEEYK